MSVKSAFIEFNPPNCTRDCRKIHEVHNPVCSIGFYSPIAVDQTKPHKVCIYGFSCGTEVRSSITVEPTETLSESIKKAIYDIVPKLVNDAQAEKKAAPPECIH